MAHTLKAADVSARPELGDWRFMLDRIEAAFHAGSFDVAGHFVAQIGEMAQAADHHPDVDLRYPHVDVAICSHDVFGVTSRDIDLARAISAAAVELGITADPSAIAVVEIALDTADQAEIKPFWAAVLGMSDHPRSDEELRDLSGNQPTLWFQHTTPHDEPRMRFHLDLRVPPEVAEKRIAAALAAGGVLVSDERAPRFTVLADAQGNKVCVTTGLGRD
jgi:4a-hydroxytetrahydrobiopterin dehydratase